MERVKMMISSISNSFFELCSFDKELLHNTNRMALEVNLII
ncbi:MAG: hypothetical protein ACOC2J_00360 [bacterium]